MWSSSPPPPTYRTQPRILRRGDEPTSQTIPMNERSEPQSPTSSANSDKWLSADQMGSYGLPVIENSPLISSLPSHIATKIYKSLGISPSSDPYVRIVSRYDNLMLFHFFTKSVLPVEVSHIRGIVVDMGWDDGDLYPVVCRSFPFTPEYSLGSAHLHSALFSGKPFTVTNAEEGTIIRIYSVFTESSNNVSSAMVTKWYVSTHKSINGVNSKWGTTTFGHILKDVWGPSSYAEYLKPAGTHTFLLTHTSKYDNSASMKYVGTFDSKGAMTTDGFIKRHPNIVLGTHLTVTPTDPIGDLSTIFNRDESNVDAPPPITAITAVLFQFYGVDGSDSFVKVLNPAFAQRRNTRGITPNIAIRYIEMTPQMRADLRREYPQEVQLFDNYDRWLVELPQHLARCYAERYIKKRFLKLQSYDHYIVSRTKDAYDETVPLVVNIENSLKSSSAYQIYVMIKNMLGSEMYINK